MNHIVVESTLVHTHSHFLMTMTAGAIALFCFSLLLFCSYALVSPGSSNVTADELMLLSFKSMFASAGSLASWNSSSHYCSWPGVVCSRRHPERVTSLRLGSSNLSLGASHQYLATCPFSRFWTCATTILSGRYPRSSVVSAGFRCLT